MTYSAPDFRTALDIDMATKGLNERELGRLLGLSQQSVSKWRHRNFPPLYRVDELKSIFGPDSQIGRMDFGRLAMETPKLRVSAPTGVHTNKPDPQKQGVLEANEAKAWRDGQWLDFMGHLPGALRVHYRPDSANGVDYRSNRVVACALMAPRGVPAIPEVLSDLLVRGLAERTEQAPEANVVVFVVKGAFKALREDTGDRWARISPRLHHQFNLLGARLIEVTSGVEMAQVICASEGVKYTVPAVDRYDSAEE
jgi:hypothetical protein